MYILPISDVHFDIGLNETVKNKQKSLEHSTFYSYFGKQFKEIDKNNDIIVLIAGDIGENIKQVDKFLTGFLPNSTVIFINGNHDGIYGELTKTLSEIKEEFRQNYPINSGNKHYLENSWMFLPNTNNEVAIIGSTFYTDYRYSAVTKKMYDENRYWIKEVLDLEDLPGKDYNELDIIRCNMKIAAECINDFRFGLETPVRHISPSYYLELNYKAKEEVIRCHNEIKEINPNCKIILMTHHCLSKKCVDSRFTNHYTNASYFSELEDWIDENLPNVRLVISGHIHTRVDFKFGKDDKRYIVNACGYIPSMNEPFIGEKFSLKKLIDIKDL